ncbi:SIR2-like domain-containing protein [Succinivibrio dextrinosolvens DSM 3072]|uniref:SIR2-like domain-containing protein n=1 Tax=Succinivibrio dextrinosolvens DSM 3072 TaxID=1123324 RepID=A0A1T4VH92_9GAMM|nr:SIR2 family protein [Succinivibrio dextrinosolvens]SKA64315.1 SIR2-like domain-containing protein [Succinivibrio dextrinosolvens DSM 3072]
MDLESDLKKKYAESKRIINEARLNKQLVIFVGSGTSISSGMPSWRKAISQISERLELDSDSLSLNEFLRLPQYYFNARGKKEYTQLMQDVFLYKKNLEPSLVHDLIVQFGTQTIITTNYDHLIELAAEKNSEMLRVISKDSDLPYRKSDRELIKIHGDFENDNFVLKEDDYLNYSRNFKLIENYVKSFIGTKVILFVGYSFSDPDVKQIFSWAKNILHGDFQPAYLIDSNSEYDKNVDDYYRNFGINILYSSVQLGIEYKKDEPSHNTEEMLKWLQAQNSVRKIDELYDNLKIFKEFNYSYEFFIRNVFQKAGVIYRNGYLYVEKRDSINDDQSDDLEKILACIAYERYKQSPESVYYQCDGKKCSIEISPVEINGVESIKILDILSILNKSSVSGIVLFRIFDSKTPRLPGEFSYKVNARTIFVDFERVKIPKWIDLITRFNDKELKKLLKSNSSRLNETTPDLYMVQACIYVYFKDFLFAYNSLKIAASIYYKKSESVKYFIAEVDRYYVGKLLINYPLSNVDKKDIELVRKELDLLNLEKTLMSLPNLGKGIEILKDLSSFDISYKLFQRAYSTSNKVKEESCTNYNLFTGVPAFSIMNRRIRDFFLFEHINCVTVDSYAENIQIYTLYFQSILNSVVSSELKNKSDNFFNIHADCISDFDLTVALKFIPYKDLEKFFYGLSNVPLSDDALSYLKEVLSCIDNSVDYSSDYSLLSEPVIWKILVILSHINISEDVFGIAISKLNLFLNVFNFISKKELIIIFLNNADRCGCINNDLIGNVKSLFDRYVDITLQNDNFSLGLNFIIGFLAFICSKFGLNFDDKEKCEKFIQGNLKIHCATIFPFMSEPLKRLVVNRFKTYKIQNSFDDFNFYCVAVKNKIIQPDSSVEEMILSKCEKECGKKKSVEVMVRSSSTIVNPIFHDNEYIYFVRKLCMLKVIGLVKNKKRLSEAVSCIKDDCSEWLLNPNSYEYKNFDVSWLNECADDDEYLQKILRLKKCKENIKNSLLAYLGSIKIDNYGIVRILKYFNN